MKTTKSLLTILALTLALLAQAQAQSYLTNGLVTYYPFTNGNFNDASGNGNNGVLGTGIVFGTNRFGITNSSIYFTNGTVGQFTTSVQQPINDVFTVSTWFNLPVGYTNPGETESTLRANIGLTDTASGFYNKLDKMQVVDFVGSGTTNTSSVMSFYVYSTGVNYISTPSVVADGRWHHCVTILSSSGMALYVDGVLIGTNPNKVSNEFAGYWRIFPKVGSVDDVRVFNRALSTSEVQQLYVYEAQGTCPPHAATGTATIAGGVVTGVNIVDEGCGYTNTPVVFFVGGGGTGAVATPVLQNGAVVGIAMNSLGSGYTNAPIVVFSSPVGVILNIVKAVQPTFANLTLTSNYQLQVSTDMNLWTNQGTVFGATNTVQPYSQYFNVTDWNQLFFRLEPVP